MNKRITSLALVFVLVLSILANALPVWAAPIESTQLKVVPDKTTASPGDTITYTIIMGPVSDMGSMQMALDIPTGLTYVENSGKLTDGLKTTLGFETADWTEVTKMVTGFAVAADYESATDTELAKFQCKVDDGATGSLEVGLTNLEFGSCQTFEYHTDRFSVEKTAVTITGGSVPATGVTVSPETLTLTVGQSDTLTASVDPAGSTDTVVWSSDHPEYASVDPATGKVTAVAAGTATITATAGDFSDTCTVTVNAAACTHTSKTLVAEKASDCTNKGWDAYQTCDDCGALFDASGSPLEEIPYREIDPSAHNWADEWSSDETNHWRACTLDPAHHKDEAAHNFGADDTCDTCGYERAHEHVYNREVVSDEYLQTPADCTNSAVYYKSCSCGDKGSATFTSGDPLGHDYTEELRDEDHKRSTAANCTEHDTYWYDCSRCDANAKADPAAEDKYYNGEPGPHSYGADWVKYDEHQHGHKCEYCGDFKDLTPHVSGPEATEDTDQICTECGCVLTPATGHVHANHLTKVDGVEPGCTTPGNDPYYECNCGHLFKDASALVPTTEEEVKREPLGHDWADEWSSDETNHWHACTRCPEKDALIAHTPDRPEATETDPIKCTQCGYVIAPVTEHLCIEHLTEVPEVPATCITTGIKAHFECTCGKIYWDDDAFDEITDPEDLTIPVIEHNWASEWSSDETNHWHACQTPGCDAKTDEFAHSPDHPDGATFEYPVLCIECGYVMEEQLEEGDIRIELPFMLTVKKTGDLDPNAQAFSFVAEEFGAPVDYTLVQSTLDTNGVGVYNGSFVFTIRESDKDNLQEGFVFRQVKGSAEGWTYDETKFYAVPIYNENDDGVEFWNIYYLDEEGMPDEDNRPNGVSFTNSYYAEKTVEPSVPAEPSAPSAPAATAVPTNSNVPQTGDDSNLAFWIVLLLAGGCGAVIAGFRKKGNSDEE